MNPNELVKADNKLDASNGWFKGKAPHVSESRSQHSLRCSPENKPNCQAALERAEFVV